MGEHTEQCAYCFNCENCFGCCGLVGKKFHIFNKEYSEQDYKNFREKIIEHMKSSGEYGEFFPGHFAPHPYEESYAHSHWPLSEEEQKKLGFRIQENFERKNADFLPLTEIPDSSKNVGEEIFAKNQNPAPGSRHCRYPSAPFLRFRCTLRNGLFRLYGHFVSCDLLSGYFPNLLAHGLYLFISETIRIKPLTAFCQSALILAEFKRAERPVTPENNSYPILYQSFTSDPSRSV